jgi:hypothetical protein
MTPRRLITRTGRKRRAAGWTLLALGLLGAGVWVWSGWVWPAYCTSTRMYVLRGGMAGVKIDDRPVPPARYTLGWSQQVPSEHNWPGGWSWFPLIAVERNEIDYGVRPLSHRSTTWVAIWPIPPLLWTPAALLLRSGIPRAAKGELRHVRQVRLLTRGACPHCRLS